MRSRLAGEVDALGSFVALEADELVQTDGDAKLSKLRRAVNNLLLLDGGHELLSDGIDHFSELQQLFSLS